MRLISNEELQFIAGSDSGWTEITQKLALAAGLGTAGGVSMGISSAAATATTAEVLAVGTLGGVVAVGLTAAWIAGTYVGERLNENTPIQGWIADVLDFSFGGGSPKSDASYFQNVAPQ